VDDETIERGNGNGTELDLRSDVDVRDGVDLYGRLRFAAGSLAADFTGALPLDVAEELIFSSAEGLLAAASVTDFVPILAERRARRTVRTSGWAPPPAAADEPPAPPAAEPPSADEPPAPPAPQVLPPPAAEPLLAVPADVLAQLRHGVEGLRGRVDAWRADLTQR